MKIITDKSLCCGCTACMNVCPAQCIVMRRDREGFDYPVANPDLCTGCGKCEEVCPQLDRFTTAKPVADREFKNIFMEGAREVLSQGGVVFGPLVNEDRTVGIAEAEDMETVTEMLDLKSVQSDPYGTFTDVKDYLEEGRKVLFMGAPCLVEGLSAYLGGHENLTLVSHRCRGVTSSGLAGGYATRKKSRGLRPSCKKCRMRAANILSLIRLFKRR